MNNYCVYLSNDDYERTEFIGGVEADSYDEAMLLAEQIADKYPWGDELYIERTEC